MNEVIETDYFENLKNIQIQENFQKESQVISEFIQKYKIPVYIDFGCWYGYLMKKVLKKNPTTEFIAVDAVFDFLQIAKRNNSEYNGSFYNVAIKPSSTSVEKLFRIDYSDTSKSGFDASGDPLRGTTILSISEFFDIYPIQKKFSDGYLKLDLEGLDICVLEELFALNITPKVIHFEVLKRTKSKFIKFIPVLKANNYIVHPLQTEKHKFSSIICTSREFVEIGFYPYKEYNYG